MNFKENESPTKLRGGYYTEPEIASFLLRWVLQTKPKAILEPSCGDGVFFRCLENLDSSSIENLTGFEIETSEIEKARKSTNALKHIKKVELNEQDFLEWFLSNIVILPTFDAVIGNPPFIRYQYLENRQQQLAESIFKQYNLKFTKHTNAWVPFVISSIALLKPGGRLAMVLPSELLHILHAESLRGFLTYECSRLLIFDPQELWFEDTLQGAILLLAEKKTNKAIPSKGVGIIQTKSKQFLEHDPQKYFSNADYANGNVLTGKWMRAFLTHKEREILSEVVNHPSVYSFSEIADVAVGIVTGANNFFLVPDKIVEEYHLQEWSHPMFGRSEHVPGVVYDESVHQQNQKNGLPTNFIWLTDTEPREFPQSVQRYIELGQKKGLHKRYKCRIREPWYTVPSVYSTPVAMLKRSHDFPRLISNVIHAYTTDTAYRIQPKKVKIPSLVYSFINSATMLTAEIEGRHYGGGVLELVPSEIRKLVVPLVQADVEKVYELDKDFRGTKNPEEILENQNRTILKELGFSNSQGATLHDAWSRLRLRRQRKD